MTELLPVNTRHHRMKLTAEAFELLNQHGAFAAYRKTELIDGDIYFVNAQHRPHGMVKMRLYDALRDELKRIGSDYRPVAEFTLSLSPTDRPEPDLMLTNQPDGAGFVPLASVPLVIEVSDTTLRVDLGKKLRRYAKAGIPEYWVADVNGREIHRMWSPTKLTYEKRDKINFGDPIAAASIDNLIVDTDAL